MIINEIGLQRVLGRLDFQGNSVMIVSTISTYRNINVPSSFNGFQKRVEPLTAKSENSSWMIEASVLTHIYIYNIRLEIYWYGG